MAPWVQAPASNLDDLSFITKTCHVVGENQI